MHSHSSEGRKVAAAAMAAREVAAAQAAVAVRVEA
jgi:hypothetical protein